MNSNSVTINIHLYDGAPGPTVHNLSGLGAADALVGVELVSFPSAVTIVVSSAAQVDRLIAALTAAKELLTGGAS
jgi:hypothetical protein